VTFEDIIEEILGDIEDEFDSEEKSLIKEIQRSTFVVDTSINVDDLEETLGIELENVNEEYTTLNGYLIDKFGKIPKTNQRIKTKNYFIRVLKTSKKRVLEVEIFVK